MPDPDFNLFHPEPLLMVISGPSGVGKDSVLDRLKERGLPFHFVITATDRTPRPGEVDGVDYNFVSTEAFERMIAGDELLEHAIVYGEHKGVPKQQVREALASDKDVVMRVDVQGAITIRKLVPQAVLIFLTTRSEQELIERLKRRGTESEQDLSLRIATAHQELGYAAVFDYAIVNADGQLDEAVDTVIAILRAEHHHLPPRRVSL